MYRLMVPLGRKSKGTGVEIFWSSVDLTRIVFLTGALLALLYKKKFGVTPRGIIVPGVLTGILFFSVTAFLMTLATAVLCYVIYRFTFGRWALDKRWASLITISMSVTLSLISMAVIESTHLFSQEIMLFTLAAPGLIAISARKYGPGKVLLGTFSVTAVCYLVGWALVLSVPYEILTHVTVQLGAYRQLSLGNPYLVLPVSLAVSILIYHRFRMRGGGYLIAPFLAAVTFSSPIQAVLLIVGIALCYGVVRLALRYTLMIGLERFVFSLFLGYIVVTALDLLATTITIPGYRPAPLVLIIAVAVLTNDLSLQALKPSLKKGFIPAQLISHLARWAI